MAGTTKRQFRWGRNEWNELKAAAEAAGYTASGALRELAGRFSSGEISLPPRDRSGRPGRGGPRPGPVPEHSAGPDQHPGQLMIDVPRAAG